MALYDHLGRPIRLASLAQEQATVEMGSVRQPYHDSVFSGLTPGELAGILEESALGEGHRYLQLATEMETRDPQYRNALLQRKVAVLGGMEWGIHPASDSPRDVKIADELSALVEATNFRRLLFDMLDGLGKGFSCSEIHWEASERQWRPTFEHKPAHFFKLNTINSNELRLIDNVDMYNGVELRPYKWVVHVPRLISAHPLMAGLARPVSVYHLFKRVSVRDWVIYAEVFGMPIRIGKYPADKASDRGAIAELRRAVQQIGSDACAVMSEDMTIEFQGNVTGAGSEVHESLARYCDEQISKAVMGQTMTADSGSSLSQSEVHERVLEAFGENDAENLVADVQRDVIIPYVRLNHGDVGLPAFWMARPADEVDGEAFTRKIVAVSGMGIRVPQGHVREALGIPEPEGSEPVVGESEGDGEEGPQPPPGGQAKPRPGGEPVAQPNSRETNASKPRDVLDRMASLYADEWEVVMSSLDAAMARLENAHARGGDDAVMAELQVIEAEGTVDGTALMQRLATGCFVARGLGDVTDSVR